MLIGILSDSHGDHEATSRGIEVLERHGARVLFHCGDICGERVLDAFVGRAVHFVWGNCDDPTPALRRYVVDTLGLQWPQHPIRVMAAGKRIALYHGHERGIDAALRHPDFDYLLYGHTHVADDRRDNGVRLINPGALHRVHTKTVATLDVASDVLTYYALDGEVFEP